MTKQRKKVLPICIDNRLLYLHLSRVALCPNCAASSINIITSRVPRCFIFRESWKRVCVLAELSSEYTDVKFLSIRGNTKPKWPTYVLHRRMKSCRCQAKDRVREENENTIKWRNCKNRMNYSKHVLHRFIHLRLRVFWHIRVVVLSLH